MDLLRPPFTCTLFNRGCVAESREEDATTPHKNWEPEGVLARAPPIEATILGLKLRILEDRYLGSVELYNTLWCNHQAGGYE